MIHTVNYFFTRVFDVLLYPFNLLGSFWGVFFLSVLMSFVVLYAYKWVSSPRKIKETKDRIKANILAIRIYRDLWKVIVSSFFKSLYYTFKYFFLNFGPVLLILPILFPIFVQMDIRYGMRPYKVGEDIVLKARFHTSLNGMEIQAMESPYFKARMNPVFITALDEVNWKFSAQKKGKTVLRVKVDGEVYEKEIAIGRYSGALCNKKLRGSQWGHFLYPAEKALPSDGPVESLIIEYPGGDVSVLGIKMHWLVLNIILVLVIVLALKNRFGIEF